MLGFPFVRCSLGKPLPRSLQVNVLLACCFAVLKQLLPLEQMIGSLAESLLLGAVWALFYMALMAQTGPAGVAEPER